MTKLLTVIALFITGYTYGQSLNTDDRMFLKISADIVKLEQDIYLPKLAGNTFKPFVRWEYEYKNGLLTTERSYDFKRAGAVLWTERKIEYKDGKRVADSVNDILFPTTSYYTTYTYNKKGWLVETSQVDKTSKKISRIDLYKNYRDETSYKKSSQFYGEDNKKTRSYISVFENGLKRSVVYSRDFLAVKYEYDSSGMLTARGSRKYFYKLDKRGNPIACVGIENGMRMYDFMQLTYADGLVTGSLVPDAQFMEQWDAKK